MGGDEERRYRLARLYEKRPRLLCRRGWRSETHYRSRRLVECLVGKRVLRVFGVGQYGRHG
jgi:hypothetical protein